MNPGEYTKVSNKLTALTRERDELRDKLETSAAAFMAMKEVADKIGQDLADATAGKCTCSGCRRMVNNAWRDGDGHWCLTCLAGQRDQTQIENMELKDRAYTDARAYRDKLWHEVIRERDALRDFLFMVHYSIKLGGKVVTFQECDQARLAALLETSPDECQCQHEERDHGICLLCGEDRDPNSNTFGAKP